MADGAELPAWLTQLGASIVPALALLGFVVNRADRINNKIDANDEAAMQGITAAKTEAADAILAVISRFDARHEALRQESSRQMDAVLARINTLSDTMARREDMDAISQRLDTINGRMDRILDKG